MSRSNRWAAALRQEWGQVSTAGLRTLGRQWCYTREVWNKYPKDNDGKVSKVAQYNLDECELALGVIDGLLASRRGA